VRHRSATLPYSKNDLRMLVLIAGIPIIHFRPFAGDLTVTFRVLPKIELK